MLPVLPASNSNTNLQLIIGNIGNWQHSNIGNIYKSWPSMAKRISVAAEATMNPTRNAAKDTQPVLCRALSASMAFPSLLYAMPRIIAQEAE